MTTEIKTGHIYRGRVAGVFVVLGFRQVCGETLVQVKPVDPTDHSRTLPGEIALPPGALVPLDR